ncbi:MAG TPA: hypothetical protein VJ746_02775 [Nitrospira sp.]|nr:hypothetical protein [Nitrospira sp.]
MMRSIVDTLGEADVAHVFLHHCTSWVDLGVLRAYAPGYQHFDQRALLLARANDIVCVAGHVEPAYLHFLSRLGLGPNRDRLMELSIRSVDGPEATLTQMILQDEQALEAICNLVSKQRSVVIHPYYASPSEWQLATELQRRLNQSVHVLGGDPATVARVNLKHHIHSKARELGVPVAPGELVELDPGSHDESVDLTPLQEAIERYLPCTGRVIVRATDQRTKRTRLVVTRGDSIEKAFEDPDTRPLSNLYLVQAMFDIVTTPNVQLFVEAGRGAVSWVGLSDQCLDEDLAHRGNVFPSESRLVPDMLRSAYTLARWLQGEGYTGIVGFDFVEYIDPETRTRAYLLAEINARVNEATYPRFLMEHLNAVQAQRKLPPICAFRSAKVSLTATSFAELQDACGRELFDPETGRGAIPYNVGRLPYGRCDVALLGHSRREVEDLYDAFSARCKNPVPALAPMKP